MTIKKTFITTIPVLLLLVISGCATPPDISNSSLPSNVEDTNSYNELPDIISLDRKMQNYFDISLFNEENYSNVYLGKNFKFNISYNDKSLTVPTSIKKLNEAGFTIQEGSEYNENSYIYAKETVTIKFNDANSSFTALFYNDSNESIRLKDCSITKIRLDNNFNTKNIIHFNVNAVDNYSTVTDVITTLGTPSHFYATTENTYYFDYFISKDDRRNKIRVFVNLTDDYVTAVEASCYK